MKISIRTAVKEDMAAVHELIMELATYEKLPHEVEVTVSDLEKDGFGRSPKFTCFIAEVSDRIVGIALVYPRYSTWRGPVVHLEDLIVTESLRGKGIGTLLLKKVAEYGLDQGVRRIGWDVLDWNEPAINFYKQCGAKILDDWDIVQMDALAMKEFVGRN